MYKKYLRTKSEYDYSKYKDSRNNCSKTINKAKRKYERNIAANSKQNPKQFWKFVQSKTKLVSGISPLTDKEGKTAVTDKDKANILNSFFSSVFTKEDLNNIPKSEEEGRSKGIALTDIQVTPAAVNKKLKDLNPNKAQGPDKIPPRVLKELADVLDTPLCILFNKSLESGVIPDDWKKAEVIAIFKKGTRSDPGNYRPVSLTCVLCKLLESFVRDAIVKQMNEYGLYSDDQHGFRTKRSCVTQLLEVMEILTDCIEEGNPIDIIYLDFKKAFDSVPHQRLLIKLKSYGILGNVYNWVESFLTGRTQRVRVGRDMSNCTDVLSGIPQGSILGPVLFTIFINDISENLESFCKIFADDTKVFNISSKKDIVQKDIDILQKWTTKWDLHFNSNKCNVLHAGTKNECNSYVLNGVDKINVCTEEKDLGVIFDNKLSFEAHIQSTIKKANSVLGIIKRAFSHLDKFSFVKLYKAMVRPILEYGNVIWAPHLKRLSEEIERVQRRATKILPDLRKCPYEERMKLLKLPSLKYRRFRADMIQAFKIINQIDNLNPNNFYSFNTNNTRNNDTKLTIKYCSTNAKKFSFSYRTAKHWNKLTPQTRRANNLDHFKMLLDNDLSKLVKEYYFD